MIEYKYCSKTLEKISSHEANMLAVYSKIISKHNSVFQKQGCDLNIGLCWKYFDDDSVEYRRISFKKGYECYIYCDVQKDGSILCIPGNDEADYYPLSVSWMITTITRGIGKRIIIFNDLDNNINNDIGVLIDLLCKN